MRITNQMRRDQLLFDLERLQTDLYTAQRVLTTGREVEKSSDDPVRARKAMVVRSSLRRRDQYVENVRHGMSRLSFAEAQLMSVSDLLRDGRAKSIQAANDAISIETRQALADDIDNMLNDLVSLANSRQDNAYTFGGFNTQEKPFNAIKDPVTGEIITVQGLTQHLGGNYEVLTADGQAIEINVSGASVFQNGSPGDDGDLFQILIDLRDALRDGGDDSGAIIEGTLTRFDNAIESTGRQLTIVGGRYERLSRMEERHLDIEVRETDQLANAEDADLADWMTRFQLQTIALQQAMAVGTQVLNASLVNFIR